MTCNLKDNIMKVKIFYVLCLFAFGCSQTKQVEKEYFVRQCSFVCDYPFDEISKYAITCRVWGLLKYYHPSVTAGKVDWDKVLLDALDNIKIVDSPETTNLEIMKMIQTAGEYKISKERFNDSLNVNVNLCWIDSSFLNESIKQTLYEISSITVEEPSYYHHNYQRGMDMFFYFKNEKDYEVYDLFYDYKYRLLTLFRYWNVIYYFSPYKYMMDKSWDVILSEYISKFISADNIPAYYKTITDMAVTINDGHAFTSLTSYPENKEYFTLVDTNTVVKISPEQSSLEEGDIILKIGNKNIKNIRDSIAAGIPSSNLHYTNFMINHFLIQVVRKNSEVTVLRNNNKLTLPINSISVIRKNNTESSPAFRKISDEIGYANLGNLKNAEVSGMFDNFKDTKGIILDLRNYPSTGDSLPLFHVIISHLSTKLMHNYLRFIYSDISHPGAFYWEQGFMPYSKEQIADNQYKGKIVVLIYENTISAAETAAVMYRTAGNAILIGRPTAGANGDVAKLLLPGNVKVSFSSLGAYYPDETEIQRKGVIPDIEVYPTMQSVLDGKDEILEHAISYINDDL
jgi:hypothetical protein